MLSATATPPMTIGCFSACRMRGVISSVSGVKAWFELTFGSSIAATISLKMARGELVARL